MGAKMYDSSPYNQAGLPMSSNVKKYSNAVDQNGNVVTAKASKYNLDYDSLYIIMREQNRIETLERYQWVNLPFGITADIIERLLYYRGRGILYFNDKVGKFQFLPYALNDVIDEYGRYTRCNTLPFTGVDETKDKKKKKPVQAVYQNLEIVYDLPYTEEAMSEKEFVKRMTSKPVGIILNDSSIGVSQQPTIRYNYVEPVLRMMATLMQIINTAMYGAADHNLLQVENEGEYDSIKQQIDAINENILKGRRFTPITANLPITPLKTSNTADLEGLFGTFNSLSNFLKSITGISNAGVFDKKAHLLQEEQMLNGSNSDDIYYNGLRMRQEFCLLVQAYYKYPVWCYSKRGNDVPQGIGVQDDGTEETPVQNNNNNNQGGNDNGRA